MLKEKNKLVIPIIGSNGAAWLQIYPQTARSKVFEETDSDAGTSGYQLIEGSSYMYEFLGSDTMPCQFEREDEIISFHPDSTNHGSEGTLNTGIYVGLLTVGVVCVDTGERIGNVALEIRSTKSDYQSDYRLMLDEIAEYYLDLVLQQGSPVTQHLAIDPLCDSKTLYQRFSFVRSLIDSDVFLEAIHKIISNPIRRWQDTKKDKSISSIKRITHANIRQMASSSDRIHLPMGVREKFGLESVPRIIDVVCKKDTTDILENQFVKFVLRMFVNFCSDIAQFKNASDRLKAEAEDTRDQLYEHLDNTFFRQVSMPTHLNLNSPVLQHKDGYREVLQAWLFYDLSAKLEWTGSDDVYEAGKKNVAVLYEYWLFFKLLELVSEFFGIEPEAKHKLVDVDDDHIGLNLKQGRMQMVHGRLDTNSRTLNVAFYYNRTFHRQDTAKCSIQNSGSWTMTMRPDYTLTLWPGNISEADAERQELLVHIHFDAKYRLNKLFLNDKVEPLNLDIEKQLEEMKIYKRGDLLKMHAYKDAIRRTSGAYVLYPGTENHVMRGFHEIVPGLGAFSIRPEHWQEDSSYLRLFLSEVKTHMLDRISEREKLSFHHFAIHAEPNKSRLITRLPEPIGNNRDFLPDETYVIICRIANLQLLAWTKEHSLCIIRLGDAGQCLSMLREEFTARYAILYSKDKAEILKLSQDSAIIFNNKKLDELQYPLPHENREDSLYLGLSLSVEGIEQELSHNVFNVEELDKKQDDKHCDYSVIKLSELFSTTNI